MALMITNGEARRHCRLHLVQGQQGAVIMRFLRFFRSQAGGLPKIENTPGGYIVPSPAHHQLAPWGGGVGSFQLQAQYTYTKVYLESCVWNYRSQPGCAPRIPHCLAAGV